MPPRLASAPGSIGKNKPVWRISLFSCMRVTPACTVTVRSSGCTATTLFMRPRSMLTPPCTASRCPSSDEPTPNGITGTAYWSASLTTSATSSVLSQNTTTSGGGASNGDSSRPCCSRTAIAVEQRAPKRCCREASMAAGTGRGSRRGSRWAGRGAFIEMSPGRTAAFRPLCQGRASIGQMSNRLTQIATRTGDDGTTGLGDGTRVPKDHLRVQAMGDVDELNSQLGVLLAEPLPEDVRELLVVIQHELFNLGGELSWPGGELIKDAAVLRLDEALEHYNANLPRLKEFILPAGTRSAAIAHVCRTIARRAERAVVTLAGVEAIKPAPRQYL